MRYVGFPVASALLSRSAAQKLFLRAGERILYRSWDVSDDLLGERVLIKRPFGVEDACRYWSMEMLLEHLIRMGVGIRGIIRSLSLSTRPGKSFDLSDFRPEGGRGPKVREEYRHFLESFDREMESIRFCSRQAHMHPGLGPMNAVQWLNLAAFTMDRHRVQAERIVRNL